MTVWHSVVGDLVTVCCSGMMRAKTIMERVGNDSEVRNWKQCEHITLLGRLAIKEPEAWLLESMGARHLL